MASIRRLIVLVLLILAAGLLVSCVPIPPYDPVLAQRGVNVQQEGAAMPAATATAAAPMAEAEPTSTPAALTQVEPTSTPRRPRSSRLPYLRNCPGGADEHAGDACTGRSDEYARDCDDHAGQSIGCPGAGGADAYRCARADADADTQLHRHARAHLHAAADQHSRRDTDARSDDDTRCDLDARAHPDRDGRSTPHHHHRGRTSPRRSLAARARSRVSRWIT